ncbi:MAG TPA: hypothetical protein PLO37_14700 [Candidatus Hydrogenedentes bacterium]|nr:hypothetical protein [Candidatus Hydrogenedentota bacterium]HPG68095.1 hypothetical protein [Candidatus Hydrogenedentota bacterium]
MLISLGKAEQKAVMEYRDWLSTQRGRPVSLEDALADWLKNRAVAWRAERLRRILELERQEMLRHKWIESEKAHRDLGSEAIMDWIQNHAAKWREWYEREYEGECDTNTAQVAS